MPQPDRHERSANRTVDGLATQFESSDDSPGLLLWQLTNRWQAAQRAALKAHGLTHVQFVLLASLVWLGARADNVTQKDLADHAATDPMMTSQVLRALEDKGLVRRREHPADGRAKVLAVTAAGKRLADLAVVDVEACDTAFFAPLGDEVPTFVTFLQRLT